MYSLRVTISLFCSYMLILHITSSTVSPALALKDCKFPAIFNFGASNSDTGGFAASLFPPTAPYGETYFHMPVGRFSDGRLIIDFLGMFFQPSLCIGDIICKLRFSESSSMFDNSNIYHCSCFNFEFELSRYRKW